MKLYNQQRTACRDIFIEFKKHAKIKIYKASNQINEILFFIYFVLWEKLLIY